jgi:hypothetical protein
MSAADATLNVLIRLLDMLKLMGIAKQTCHVTAQALDINFVRHMTINKIT